MKIQVFDTDKDLDVAAFRLLTGELEKKKGLLLCAATGNSPTGLYAQLISEYQQRPDLFQALRVIKLDEWGGLPMNDPGTCESYLRQHLIGPLGIDDERYIRFQSNPADPALECRRIQDLLDKSTGIDVCLLGLGMNGHIAFNEPDDYLKPDVHVASLSPVSLGHSMTSVMGGQPRYGLTLGMKSILDARLILMMISGKQKKAIARALLSGRITTRLPASFLWLHERTICLMDRDAFDP